MKRIALGSGWRNYGKGWTHVDGFNYPQVDVVSEMDDLFYFEDESVDILYASHLLEYFNRQEAVDVLMEWKRVLKPGGKLYVSVPDFQIICGLYNSGVAPLHCFVGPLYGQMDVEDDSMKKTIYHKTVYDYSALGELLKMVGFGKVGKYVAEDLVGKVDDHSKAKINGKIISLNVVCTKNG